MISRRTIITGASMLISAISLSTGSVLNAHDFEEIPLWLGKAPGNGEVSGPEKVGAEGAGYGAVSNVSNPRMRVYRPNAPNGTAILVIGGGGYFRIQLWKESTPAAKWLQLRGYTVFELIHRLPGDGWDAAVPFMDAQRAMKIIRHRANEFGIRSDRIGIMGFSAGGHLAGYTALNPGQALYEGRDTFEAASARPDFAALLFPVVSLRKPFDTTRTRREIVGREPSLAAQEAWSLDTHVSKDAPPTILFSSADDPITPPGHNIALFEALNGAGANVEMHIFSAGGHGWGLGKPEQTLSQWPTLFDTWLASTMNKKN
ncbi:alpha/beta hydrolase [Allopontixanthobacter sediminis]|uniref:Prolyl oligopeptidase family serine peptidase n=1 Tax=Allopontixanthobacter sediminis TaxID=1689985 RepID=A0A845B5A8_9SPHN|nr:alpha/beta hydrolase [Allopontixanthobacter sediminis]MXP45336.1 prolyl oligopeptidase family serine peptidase [Allopontixanthobacter sediminis]